MRFVRAILIAAVAVMPLALVPGIFLSHDVMPKVILILTGAALLLLFQSRWNAGLALLWRQRTGRLFLLLVAAELFSLAVSTLFSNQISLSVAGTLWRRFGLAEQAATLVIATALACTVAQRPGWSATLLRAVSVCGGVAAAYGILQYFGVDPLLDRALYTIDYLGGITRPPSTMGHALYFSAYLAPIVFLSGSAALCDIAGNWRKVHAATVILTLAAIVLSGTRSGLLAVIAGGLFFGWRRLRERGTGWKPSYSVVLPALLVLAAAGLFAISPASANLGHRMLQWKTETGGPRLQMWRETPGLIARHALIGTGPETFAVEFRKIQSAELSRAYPDFYNETPHNAFIDAACAQGIPGILILTGVFTLGWFAARGTMAAGFEAALLGIFVCSLFASLTLVASLYLWSIAGLAAASMPGDANAKSPLRFAFPRIPAYVAAAAFLFVAAALAMQDAAWAELGRAVGGKDFMAAREAWREATTVSAGMPGYELWGSREMASLGRALGDGQDGRSCWKMAAEGAAEAEKTSEERFSAAYQSSVLAIAAGDVQQAERKARETVELAPNWYKGHLLLSQILQIEGENEGAEKEARVSAALGWKR
jgi:hypothetical protein